VAFTQHAITESHTIVCMHAVDKARGGFSCCGGCIRQIAGGDAVQVPGVISIAIGQDTSPRTAARPLIAGPHMLIDEKW
jgi:hypothetical protein